MLLSGHLGNKKGADMAEVSWVLKVETQGGRFTVPDDMPFKEVEKLVYEEVRNASYPQWSIKDTSK